MHTETHIARTALARIGQSDIASIDDQSPQARKAKLFYPTARDSVLAMHPWNCAIKRVNLTALVDAPIFEFSTLFQLPDDYLRTVYVYDQSGTRIYEGDKILSDQTSFQLVYVYRLTDVSKMDPLLVEAITFRLAADLAEVLRNSDSAAGRMRILFNDALAEARLRDSSEQQQPDERLSASGWLSARHNGGYANLPPFLR